MIRKKVLTLYLKFINFEWLKRWKWLNFAYIEMAQSSFKKDIIQAYGNLKKKEVLRLWMNDESEEVWRSTSRLPNTVVKVVVYLNRDLSAALKEYSFFPFDNLQ